MKIAPPGETGNARVRLKDVLPPLRRGCPPGLYKGERHRSRYSEATRDRMSQAHPGRVQMVLIGSCQGPAKCEREECDKECASEVFVCPYFAFGGLALYLVKGGRHPSITPLDPPA